MNENQVMKEKKKKKKKKRIKNQSLVELFAVKPLCTTSSDRLHAISVLHLGSTCSSERRSQT